MDTLAKRHLRFKTTPMKNPLTGGKTVFQGRVVNGVPRGIRDIAEELVALGCTADAVTIEYVLNTFAAKLPRMVATTGSRYSLGELVTFYPVIGGSFETPTAAFDPARNDLHLAASVPRKLRGSIAAVRAYNVTPGEVSPRITHISGDDGKHSYLNAGWLGRELLVVGRDLLLDKDCPDEGAWLTGGDLEEPLALAVHDRTTKSFSAAMPAAGAVAPGDYTLLVATRAGREPAAPLYKLRHKIAVKG